MTIEELLQPRYLCIAEDTSGHWNKGEIIEFTQKDFKDRWIYNLDSETDIRYVAPAFFDEFPHLFKKLEWWEERKVEDMPEYVKLYFNNKNQYVHKVEKWTGEKNINGEPLYEFFNKAKYLQTACVSELLPATEKEYNEYNKNKNLHY